MRAGGCIRPVKRTLLVLPIDFLANDTAKCRPRFVHDGHSDTHRDGSFLATIDLGHSATFWRPFFVLSALIPSFRIETGPVNAGLAADDRLAAALAAGDAGELRTPYGGHDTLPSNRDDS